MDCKKTNTKRAVFGALLLVAGILAMSGCESDAVAPQENLPPPTEQEAAQQAALVATGVAMVSPQLLTFTGPKSGSKELGVYPYTFPEGGDISGTVILEFFTGGASGTHSAWGDADYGLLYNADDQMVTVALDLGGGIEPVFSLGFSLYGDINRATDTATVSGTVQFVSGDIFQDFVLTDIDLVAVSSYPTGGTVSLMAGPYEVVVFYDGSDTAGVSVDGSPMFTVDLNTGIISPVGE